MGKHQLNARHLARDLGKKFRPGSGYSKPAPQAPPPTAEEISEVIENHKKAKEKAPIIMTFSMTKLTEEEKQAEKDKLARRNTMAWVFKSRSIHDSVESMFNYFSGGRNHEWGRAGVR